MAWLGTQLPAGAKRPRRKSKGTKRRGPDATQRLLTQIGRAAGVIPKAKRTTEGVGRCLPHVFEELGFSSAWDLAIYLDALAARNPAGKGNVVLDPAKRPPGVRRVVGIRCKHCAGRGCHRCDSYGWGIRLVVPIKKREQKCVHDAASSPRAT